MSDRDEEIDLDRPEVTKALLGEVATKKKSKGKAKKAKEEGETRTSAKDKATLPLSMLSGTSEDSALFEARSGSLKGGASAAKAYNMNERFKTGDVINHKKFGLGFVVAESGLNKVEVVFKAGRKLLVMAAPKATTPAAAPSKK